MDKNIAPPKWFWWVSGFGLIWNLVGVLAFVGELTMDLGELPEAERLFFETKPSWATASFGIAVASGTLGCLAMLFRKGWAAPMLMLCIAGIVVQTFHSIALTDAVQIFGLEGLILPASVFLIAVGLTLVAKLANNRGWSD